jgi:TP53 regulating kinase-like protein
MEFIPGKRLKDVLSTFSPRKQQHLFQQIGKAVGLLHQGGIAHGDLTTSNMILHPLGLVYFIDFGLATTTHSIEDFGTDLHLLRRALLSAHYHQWSRCFKAFQKGYTTIRNMAAIDVFQKIDEIESRGRYISERYG